MSIRTLNSPNKMSPIKIEAFSFKGRIFEINEEELKQNQHIISQKPEIDDLITPRVDTENLPESHAPSKSSNRNSSNPSGDSGGTGTPEQLSIHSFYHEHA